MEARAERERPPTPDSIVMAATWRRDASRARSLRKTEICTIYVVSQWSRTNSISNLRRETVSIWIRMKTLYKIFFEMVHCRQSLNTLEALAPILHLAAAITPKAKRDQVQNRGTFTSRTWKVLLYFLLHLRRANRLTQSRQKVKRCRFVRAVLHKMWFFLQLWFQRWT